MFWAVGAVLAKLNRPPNADALTTEPIKLKSRNYALGSWRSGSASASHAEGHRFEPCTAHF